MQLSRLFEIIYILIEKKKVTAIELANHFEVSKRTIIRDIETLTMAGLPLYTIKGRNGGICIMENYVLNKAVISNEEQNQILMALQTMQSTQFVHTDDILQKLQTFFKKTKESRVEIDFSYWGNKNEDDVKFSVLSDAVENETTISFLYYDAFGNAAVRHVNPIKIIFKSKNWYLQGYSLDSGDYRTYKLCRIYEITALKEHFNIEDYAVPVIDLWPNVQEEIIHLELLFEQELAYRVYDEFDAQYITKNTDGTFLVCMDMPDGNWLYSLLLSFGSKVQILSPESIKNEVKERSYQIYQKYL